MKTNLTIFAVISLKKASKGAKKSSKIAVMKEKERRKTKSEENERRRREKAAVALLVFIIATMEIFGRKILFWQNTLLAVTLSQNLARCATWSITRGGSNTHLSQGNKRD